MTDESRESDIDLVMDIEVEIPSDSSYSTGSNSDEDEGEIGELLDGNLEGDGGDRATDAQPRAYRHEPELRREEGADDQQDALRELAVHGPNVDPSRLDPRNIGNWCRCGCCSIHPSFTVGECVCCRSIPEVDNQAGENGVACIMQAADFEAAILNPTVLYIGWIQFTDRWRRVARRFADRNNEKYRYVGYRQFVRWCWGYLGRDLRVQLPSCVLYAIKTAYPDRGNVYRGTTQLRPLEND